MLEHRADVVPREAVENEQVPAQALQPDCEPTHEIREPDLRGTRERQLATGTRVASSAVMSSTNSQVVVGFDFSRSGREAVYRALALAARAPFHVLHFVCVIEPHAALPALPTKEVDYRYAERVQQALTEVITAELEGMSITTPVHFYVHARIGKPAAEILALAREVGADLIVVGSKGLTGVERLVLGSVAEKVVREARCAVVVARAKSYDHVDLLEIVDATEHKRYAAPHRYTYENRIVMFRPAEWPLY
jgi:nucleotide-binding universal stress UspA family protein